MAFCSFFRTDGFFDFNSLVAGETVPSPLTEENYKAQCTEIINAKTLMGMNELKEFGTIANNRIKKINLTNGLLYVISNLTMGSTSRDQFFLLETNLNTLDKTSYEALFGSLYGFEVESMEQQTMIKPEVSAEAYANLVNFVISNSIGWGPAGTDVEILNVSTFKALTDGSGESGITMYVLKNDKFYEIKLIGASFGSEEDRIYQVCDNNDIQSGSTTVEIVSTDDYLSFDSIGSAG